MFKPSKRFVIAGALVSAAFVAGGTQTYLASAEDPPTKAESQATATESTPPPAGTTKDGRTYGPLLPEGKTAGEVVPDLVSVVGDHGIEGYADSAVVLGDDKNGPASPAEALAQQASKASSPVVTPVFAKDGVTQIDTFTLSLPTFESPK